MGCKKCEEYRDKLSEVIGLRGVTEEYCPPKDGPPLCDGFSEIVADRGVAPASLARCRLHWQVWAGLEKLTPEEWALLEGE